MSKWLVTLAYNKESSSGGNYATGISATTVRYISLTTHFVKFKGNYPTETEIKDLIEKESILVDEYVSSFNGKRFEARNYPTITFMQKLEEEVEK